MSVDVSAVYKSTIEHFKQAQKNIAIEKRMFEHSADAISWIIPLCGKRLKLHTTTQAISAHAFMNK